MVAIDVMAVVAYNQPLSFKSAEHSILKARGWCPNFREPGLD